MQHSGDPASGGLYMAYTQGLKNKWPFLCRTNRSAAPALAPVENVLNDNLIPTITGRSVNATERALLALPCRHSGLGLTVPSSLAEQYQHSKAMCSFLTNKIVTQNPFLDNSLQQVRCAKKRVQAEARVTIVIEAVALSASLCQQTQRMLELAYEKGVSAWLARRPLRRHSFALTKSDFRDGLCLRYGWYPDQLPSFCACAAGFSVSHALSCPTGGFPSVLHNEVRDVIAHLLKKVTHSVAIEPTLQPVAGERFQHCTANSDAQAQLDVSANGIWGGRFHCTFIDVRVFNLHAPSSRSSTLTATYVKHKKEKRRSYEQ